MPKKIFLLLAVIFMFGINGIVYAMACHNDSGHSKHSRGVASKAQSSSEKAVNVGNKICPVSGEKIDENLKATYEHKDKIYNFCCAFCIDEFKKDPQQYIDKIKE